MKFGFDIRRFLFNSFFTSFGRGAFQFDGTFTAMPSPTSCWECPGKPIVI